MHVLFSYLCLHGEWIAFPKHEKCIEQNGWTLITSFQFLRPIGLSLKPSRRFLFFFLILPWFVPYWRFTLLLYHPKQAEKPDSQAKHVLLVSSLGFLMVAGFYHSPCIPRCILNLITLTKWPLWYFDLTETTWRRKDLFRLIFFSDHSGIGPPQRGRRGSCSSLVCSCRGWFIPKTRKQSSDEHQKQL